MSIIYCEKHDRRWDSDKLDECPSCAAVPESRTINAAGQATAGSREGQATGDDADTISGTPAPAAPTPRTDAALNDLAADQRGSVQYNGGTFIDFARQIERELAEANTVRATLHDTCREYEQRLGAVSASQPLTDHQLARIEERLFGPGNYAAISMNTYCNVCGNNVTIGCMDTCAWKKAKAILTGAVSTKLTRSEP